MKAAALAILALLVYALHQDFWNWMTYEPLVLGFLPVGLAYHAGFAMLCAVMMAVFVKFAWPAKLENIEPHKPKEDSSEAQA